MQTTKAQISLHICAVISTFVVPCLDSIIPLVSISEISSLYLVSMATEAGMILPGQKPRRKVFPWRVILWDTHCCFEHCCLLAIALRWRGHLFPLQNRWASSWENVSSGVYDRGRPKPACSATEASWSLETLDIASIHIILFKQRTTKVLIRLHGCTGWSAPLLFAYGIRLIFAWPGPYVALR